MLHSLVEGPVSCRTGSSETGNRAVPLAQPVVLGTNSAKINKIKDELLGCVTHSLHLSNSGSYLHK